MKNIQNFSNMPSREHLLVMSKNKEQSSRCVRWERYPWRHWNKIAISQKLYRRWTQQPKARIALAWRACLLNSSSRTRRKKARFHHPLWRLTSSIEKELLGILGTIWGRGSSSWMRSWKMVKIREIRKSISLFKMI